ncbi:MAG: restriction endonuclease subunit S [Bacteroidetes bacterium]|nr:restriction endonuclease subunit S [Bacteroidota bacterium]
MKQCNTLRSATERSRNMPKNWEIKKLGEVCQILNGGTPKTGIPNYWDGNIKWITPKDMGKMISKFIAETPRTITHLGLQKSSAKLIPSNSIILSTRAPIGHLAINIAEMATNQGCRGIIPSININTYYLYYFLSKSVELLNNLGTGATFRELSTSSLSSVEIPLPPLPEQKRIVSILDKTFEAINKAKANAETNLKNAKELFESYLHGVFENKGEDWEEKTISEIGNVQTGTTPPTKDKLNYGNYISFAKPPHFKTNGNIETGDSMLSELGLKKGRLFGANSILMVCIGATIGKTGFSKKPISSNQQINALTPYSNYEPKLLYYALISDYVQKQIINQGKSAQATLPIINKSKWEKTKINIPKSKSKQQQIVKKLDALSTETKNLEHIYQQKVVDLEELKKSVLQKAFRGEL